MQTIFKRLASWLFLVGILIAVIIGLLAQILWPTTINSVTGAVELNYPTYITIALAILGFVVGIFSFFAIGNITHERIPTFLIAALILVGIGGIGQYFSNLDVVGQYFANIAATLAIFAAPAAGLLAIRAIWDAGKTEEIQKVIPKIPK
jgi:hypothetical protein